MPLLFRRLRAGGTSPLIFNASGSSFGALDATILLSGLEARQLHQAPLNGTVSPGGLAARRVHAAALNGTVSPGGMVARQIHPCALDGNLSLGGLQARMIHQCPLNGVVSPVAEWGAVYDVYVQRSMVGQCQTAIGPSSKVAAAAQTGIVSAIPARTDLRVGIARSADAKAAVSVGLAHYSNAAVDRQILVGQASRASVAVRSAVAYATPVGVATRIVVGPSSRAVASASVHIAYVSFMAKSLRIVVGTAQPIHGAVLIGLRHSRSVFSALDTAWRPAVRPKGIRPRRPPLPPPIWGGGRPGVPLILPVREFYNVFNEAYLKRVDDGENIDCISLDIETDDQSFSRRISAVLPYYERDKVSVENGPVEIEVGANGDVWRAIIQAPKDVRDFGKNACSFEAYSKSIALASPAALLRTGINANASTANQLVVAELDPYGFQVAWDIYDKAGAAIDWAVPATAFSVVNADPISAINTLIKPAGAFVLPHRANAAISVRHRYPRLPWSLASATPDIEIPVDALKMIESEWVQGVGYNGVFVGGVRFGAVALVRVEGTAGNVQAADFFDPMLTDPIVNGLAGGAILADLATKRTVSMTLDAYPEIGFVEPGQILRVIDAYPWVSICRGSRIHIEWKGESGLEVVQTLSAERFYV